MTPTRVGCNDKWAALLERGYEFNSWKRQFLGKSFSRDSA